jgi:hypothetical protein
MKTEPTYFETLNEALEAEGLTQFWPTNLNINYGESVSIIINFLSISIYRSNTTGRYERPVHYKTI